MPSRHMHLAHCFLLVFLTGFQTEPGPTSSSFTTHSCLTTAHCAQSPFEQDFDGSCGRCYEVRCRKAKVRGVLSVLPARSTHRLL